MKMKFVSAALVLLCLIYLGTEVAAFQQFQDHQYDKHITINQHRQSAIGRALEAVKFGLQTLRHEEKNTKRVVKMESLGLVRASIPSGRNCNYTDIEAKLANLIEISVDFATIASDNFEAIFNNINTCANTDFPKSISCFLHLVQACQPDVDAINAALQVYRPKFHSLIGAKPSYRTLLEDISHSKVIKKLDSAIDNVAFQLFEKSTALQHHASARSLQTHQSLASLPGECSLKQTGDMDFERRKMLALYYQCSLLEILGDIGELVLDASEYVYYTYLDSTAIIGDFLACSSAGFDPLRLIECVYHAIETIPSELRDLLALAEAFEAALDKLVPDIVHGIEGCFKRSSNNYEIFLNDVLEKAKSCKSSKLL